MANRLEKEKSPYLLQHKENPVDWYPWGEEAFQTAREEDKPVFLSIGYSTCHWCHVMAHESFENPEVAALLNRDFVCIKADREERPDIDAVYMAVCQAMTGAGGWPLTVLMTPEQKPFFAGTYFPPKSRRGQMGLLEILSQAAFLWNTQREGLLEDSEYIAKRIGNLDKPQKSGEPSVELLEKARRFYEQSFDLQWGGFGPAPKFPTPHNLLFLMDYGTRERSPGLFRMVEKTLDAMADGGICDHLGGGFSRYSTDARWLVPHFEKMLYDNALLILAYLRAFQECGKPRYLETAKNTAGYILEELTGPEGGFYCGQDADSDGVEGKYYVFTPEEIKTVLGEKDGEEFCRAYDITPAGNFEGKSIPNRIGKEKAPWKREDPRLVKLRCYRKKRTTLHRDDKCLLSWNAWTIIAFAKLGQITGEERYLQAAQKARAFIEKYMTGEDNRLFLRYREGERAHKGQLEDYAVYTLALLTLYGATFHTDDLQQAVFRGGQMRELFLDHEDGGYFMTAGDDEKLISRPKETYDGAIPSGNSVAAMVLEVLGELTGEVKWREESDRQHRFLAGAMESYPAGHAFSLLSLGRALYPQKELICAGEAVPPELREYLKTHPAEHLAVLFKSEENAEALAACAPFTKDYPVPKEGTMWYLCTNGACKAPVREFDKLEL